MKPNFTLTKPQMMAKSKNTSSIFIVVLSYLLVDINWLMEILCCLIYPASHLDWIKKLIEKIVSSTMLFKGCA